jgi:integrase
MQRGTILRHRASWTLVYRDTQFRDGQRKRVKVWKKLAAVSKEYPTKASVRHLADKILAPLNEKAVQPESSMKLQEYIDDVYFPSVEKILRPATVDSYKFISRKLEGKLDIRLRDFRTVHGQRLLREVNVGRRTLVHIKAFLSAVFKHCKQEGILDGQNPMTDTSVPGRPLKFKGVAYSMPEIARMLDDLEPSEENEDRTNQAYVTAGEVITILAFTGLRVSECRGLRWEDWDEEKMLLNISRSVWETKVGPTKNQASESSIPVIPLLKAVLDARRRRLNANPQDYIFAGERRGGPLNFHNLENRIIRPALEASMMLKPDEKGKWLPDPSTGIVWKGYHGFRRGLATNLFSLGVNPKIVAAILRHSDVGTTLAWYIQTPDAESREAMRKVEAKYSALLSSAALLSGEVVR